MSSWRNAADGRPQGAAQQARHRVAFMPMVSAIPCELRLVPHLLWGSERGLVCVWLSIFDRLGVCASDILVSPYVANDIDSTLFDHTSMLRYLQVKWGLGGLGARTAAGNSIGGLTDVASAVLKGWPWGWRSAPWSPGYRGINARAKVHGVFSDLCGQTGVPNQEEQ